MQQLHEIDLKIGFTTISECFHEVDRGGLSLVKFETFLADKPPMKKNVWDPIRTYSHETQAL